MRKANEGDFLLTRREIQILELVAQGLSAKEVAQSIAIAPRTVEGHIDTIRLKLHARNRPHMVTKAIAARLLTVDSPAVASSPTMDVPEPLLKLVSPIRPSELGNIGCA
ncbi:response regulator transcription factor [Sphingobium mellinum]|uniref:response regulator transcription factor n=1 Tax=Sphingobium mellinum TaxID=1387166 RepID=UPI0030EBC5D8